MAIDGHKVTEADRLCPCDREPAAQIRENRYSTKKEQGGTENADGDATHQGSLPQSSSHRHNLHIGSYKEYL